jgi:hypothetical protein
MNKTPPEVIAGLLRGELATRFDVTRLQYPYREIASRMLNANGEGPLGALADVLDAMPKDEAERYWDAIIAACDRLDADHG